MNHTADEALARLDDYVRAKGMGDAEAAYEEDLFERALAGLAPELGVRAGVASALKEMRERGTLDPWLTRAQIDGLSKLGLKVVHHVFDVAAPDMPDIPDDADLVVTRIPVDLSGVTRLEAEVLTVEGKVLKLMPDIHFEREEGALFACCEADLARAAASVQRMTRFWATGDGERRLILEAPAF